MAEDRFYSTPEWRLARDAALRRDGSRCTIAQILGGECSAVLDVHHIVPIVEGGERLALDNLLTACHTHHPMVEAIRRAIVQRRRPKYRRCRHPHRSREAREMCERRLNRAAA